MAENRVARIGMCLADRFLEMGCGNEVQSGWSGNAKPRRDGAGPTMETE